MLYLIPFLLTSIPLLQADPWFNNYKEAHNVYKHYNEEKPLLIMYGASWCGPCKMLKAEFNKIKQDQLHDKYICVYIDIDKAANKYLITHAQKTFPTLWKDGIGVPTVVVIGANRKGARLGYMDVKEIVSWLHKIEEERRQRIKPKEEKPVKIKKVPTSYYMPSFAPSSGCPTCY